MKKLKIFAIALALVAGLAVGVFAISKLTTKTVAQTEAASCCADASCCAGGSCKMGGSCCGDHAKHKTAHVKAETGKSCCGDANCCADGKCKMGGACCGDHASCPMKKSEQEKSMRQAAFAVPTENGTMSCHDKNKAQTATGEHKDCCASGASCCAGGGGACCKTKKMTAKL